jgi:hypothetical protein
VDAACPDLARAWPAGARSGGRSGLTLAAESSVHFPAFGCCPGVSVGGRPGKGRVRGWLGRRFGRARRSRAGPIRCGRPARSSAACSACRTRALMSQSSWPAMVTNCVLHGGSSVPGEAVMVTVVVWDAGVRVEVTGRKADGVPVLRRPDDGAEGSRGLRLVEDLAVRWGYVRGGGEATT